MKGCKQVILVHLDTERYNSEVETNRVNKEGERQEDFDPAYAKWNGLFMGQKK